MITYKTIEEAWFFSCKKVLTEGYKQKIERGSFVGHERSQFESLAFEITNGRPLTTSFKGKNITTEPQIEKYFQEHIINLAVKYNEIYTYGERIHEYLSLIIKILKNEKNTNQAIIEVAKPDDAYLEDPPCLRVISWKVVNGKLNLTSFWRSWDLCNGLPVNLGGLQLLNELVASETDLEVGKLICFSDGGHVYDMSYSMFE